MPRRNLTKSQAHSAYSSTSSLNEERKKSSRFRSSTRSRQVLSDTGSDDDDWVDHKQKTSRRPKRLQSSDSDSDSDSDFDSVSHRRRRRRQYGRDDKLRQHSRRSRQTNLIDSFMAMDIKHAAKRLRQRQVYHGYNHQQNMTCEASNGYVLGGHGADHNLAALSRAARNFRLQKLHKGGFESTLPNTAPINLAEIRNQLSTKLAVSIETDRNLDRIIRDTVDRDCDASLPDHPCFILLRLESVHNIKFSMLNADAFAQSLQTLVDMPQGVHAFSVVWWGCGEDESRIIVCLRCNTVQGGLAIQQRYGRITDGYCKSRWSPRYWHTGMECKLVVLSELTNQKCNSGSNSYVLDTAANRNEPELPFSNIASSLSQFVICAQEPVNHVLQQDTSNLNIGSDIGTAQDTKQKPFNDGSPRASRSYTMRDVACSDLPQLLDLCDESIVPLQQAFNSHASNASQQIVIEKLVTAVHSGIQVLCSTFNHNLLLNYDVLVGDALQLIGCDVTSVVRIGIEDYLRICLVVALLI